MKKGVETGTLSYYAGLFFLQENINYTTCNTLVCCSDFSCNDNFHNNIMLNTLFSLK